MKHLQNVLIYIFLLVLEIHVFHSPILYGLQQSAGNQRCGGLVLRRKQQQTHWHLKWMALLYTYKVDSHSFSSFCYCSLEASRWMLLVDLNVYYKLGWICASFCLKFVGALDFSCLDLSFMSAKQQRWLTQTLSQLMRHFYCQS